MTAQQRKEFIQFNYEKVSDKSVDGKVRRERVRQLLGQLYTTSEQLKKLREDKKREIAELKKQYALAKSEAQRFENEVAVLEAQQSSEKAKKVKDVQLLTRPAKDVTKEKPDESGEVTVEGVKYMLYDGRIWDHKTGANWGTYDAKKKTVTFFKPKIKLHERRKKR